MKTLMVIVLLLFIGIASFRVGRYLSPAQNLAIIPHGVIISDISNYTDKITKKMTKLTNQSSPVGTTIKGMSPTAIDKFQKEYLIELFIWNSAIPSTEKLMQAYYYLQQKQIAEVKTIFLQVLDLPIKGKFVKSEALIFIAGRMNELDTTATLSFLSSITNIDQTLKLNIFSTVLIAWSNQSPILASEWLLSNNTLNNSERQNATTLIIEQLALKDFSYALKFSEQIGPQYYENAISGIAMACSETEQFLLLRDSIEPDDKSVLDVVNSWWMKTKPAEMAAWVSEKFTLEAQAELKEELYNAYIWHDIVDASIWYESITVTPEPAIMLAFESFYLRTNYLKVFEYLETRPKFNKYYDKYFFEVLELKPEFAYRISSNSTRSLLNGKQSLNLYRALLYSGSELAEQMRIESRFADDAYFIDATATLKASVNLPY